MTFALIALNLAAFLLESLDPERSIALFALWPPAPFSLPGAAPFHFWQLLTYSLLHAGGAHLLFNMFGVYMFGRDVEGALGGKRLALLYTSSVLSGAMVQLLVQSLMSPTGMPTVGASAGVFGLLLAYAALFPRRRVVLLFPPIPMPAWVFATSYAVIELLLGVSGAQASVAHFAHLGGMAGALACLIYWSRARTPHID